MGNFFFRVVEQIGFHSLNFSTHWNKPQEIWDALLDLVPFVQFNNVKNTDGVVILLVQLHSSMVFLTFLICRNDTKSRKGSSCSISRNFPHSISIKTFIDKAQSLFECLTLSWRRPLHIETSPFICSANKWTGFYMIGSSVIKEFIQIYQITPANPF